MLAIDSDGRPTLAYQDGKASVLHDDGGAWVTMGTAGVSDGTAGSPRLAFAPDGSPTLAYLDGATSPANRLSALRYTGSGWLPVGAAGFSDAAAAFPTLALAPDGAPLVAYQDSATSRATALRFAGGWTALGAPGLSTPAAPATTVTMNAPQSLIANLSGAPALRAQVTTRSGETANRVWTITLTNSGTGTATGVQITALRVAVWSGDACTPQVQNAFPVAVANVAPGTPQTAQVAIDFGTCAATTKFKADIGYRLGPGGGTTSYTNMFR